MLFEISCFDIFPTKTNFFKKCTFNWFHACPFARLAWDITHHLIWQGLCVSGDLTSISFHWESSSLWWQNFGESSKLVLWKCFLFWFFFLKEMRGIRYFYEDSTSGSICPHMDMHKSPFGEKGYDGKTLQRPVH